MPSLSFSYYCTWDSLSFLDQWVDGFHQIWRFYNHYFFKCIFCLPPSRTPVPPIFGHLELSHSSLMLFLFLKIFKIFLSLFSLCLTLHSFICCVFKVIHLFFCNVKFVTNPILWYFFSKSTIWVFYISHVPTFWTYRI